LRRSDFPSRRGAHLLPRGPGGLRHGGGFRPATIQHLAKFGNLRVDTLLLGFEARDGGYDNFIPNFVCRHRLVVVDLILSIIFNQG
jgi:hypothetical protein